MARPKSIEKDEILKAAEALITETGGLHFTMDLVAARAGISKGGLTYSYPTKDALIEDMLRRELRRFVSLRESETRGNAPLDRLEAHIRVSAEQKAVYLTRAAHLMAALSSHPDHRKHVQAFYREAFELADPATEEGRRATLPALWEDFDAFLALAEAGETAAAAVAAADDAEALRAAGLRLRATCDTCHARFSQPYTPPEVRQEDLEFDFDSVLP